MARPASEIILSTEIRDDFGVDVLKAQGLWVVLYNDEPINVRQRHWGIKGEIPKYIRSAYPNRRPAENMAEKLNQYFYTDKFSVKKVI